MDVRPRISLRLEERNYEHLNSVKSSSGLSLNEIINFLISEAISKQKDPQALKYLKKFEESRFEIRVYLSESELKKLKEFQRHHGTNSLPKEAKFLILQGLSNNGYLSEVDAKPLLDAVREVRKIGVNINQIARALNENSDKKFTADMKKFNEIAAEIDAKVKDISEKILFQQNVLRRRLGG